MNGNDCWYSSQITIAPLDGCVNKIAISETQSNLLWEKVFTMFMDLYYYDKKDNQNSFSAVKSRFIKDFKQGKETPIVRAFRVYLNAIEWKDISYRRDLFEEVELQEKEKQKEKEEKNKVLTDEKIKKNIKKTKEEINDFALISDEEEESEEEESEEEESESDEEEEEEKVEEKIIEKEEEQEIDLYEEMMEAQQPEYDYTSFSEESSSDDEDDDDDDIEYPKFNSGQDKMGKDEKQLYKTLLDIKTEMSKEGDYHEEEVPYDLEEVLNRTMCYTRSKWYFRATDVKKNYFHLYLK